MTRDEKINFAFLFFRMAGMKIIFVMMVLLVLDNV